jgi:hypothetical protein
MDVVMPPAPNSSSVPGGVGSAGEEADANGKQQQQQQHHHHQHHQQQGSSALSVLYAAPPFYSLKDIVSKQAEVAEEEEKVGDVEYEDFGGE